jgi:trans-aconitate methyltransferase
LTRSYGDLCTLFYDAEKPEAGSDEVDYYADLIRSEGEPALEAMCGSGRLMLPLLRLGLRVHGVDSSPAMLRSLVARCTASGLPPPIAQRGTVEGLTAKVTFRVALIALGSFQLLVDERVRGRSLAALRGALVPGGNLAIQAFVPDFTSPGRSGERSVTLSDGSKIVLKTSITLDRARQVYHSRNYYVRIDADKAVAHEEEEFSVRWYSPQQLADALSEAGFRDIKLVGGYKDRSTPLEHAKFFIAEARSGA